MTNGEKFKAVFGVSQVDEGELYAFAWLPNYDVPAEFYIDWWNAEYKAKGFLPKFNKILKTITPQEPIDYKTQYENYLKKSEVVISQLRADRDRLQDAFDKVRAEVENHCGLIKEDHCKYCSYCNSVMGVREILEVIDKYKVES